MNGIGAREKYIAKPSRSTTTLVTFGLLQLRGVGDAAPQRAHLERGIGGERRDRGVDRLGREQRLVPLDVDDHVAVERRGDFGEPVGAALVGRRGHDRLAAERVDRVEDARRRRSRR